MTTEQTITIHHEPPPPSDQVVIGYSPYAHHRDKPWHSVTMECVWREWGQTYTAWYDPQIGEPVKPRRYVVRVSGDGWNVIDTQYNGAVAGSIPTREAAQAIADIYERAAEGGE